MKPHEYLIVAGISILAVYAANRFLSNFTVYTVGTAPNKTLAA